jgi:glycosyltransferase involved in cell wall biosynthesis
VIRIALIHDWLTGMRGGEYVLEGIAELFPQAELFTLLYIPNKISPSLSILKRHTSRLQKMPQAEKRYRYYLPLMPSWIEKFDLSSFDLIISSSHCVAKGVRKPARAVHVSYIHAPMRYMWDRYDDYFGPGRASLFTRAAVQLFRKRLQRWDVKVSSEDRVDCFVANSRYIASKVQALYHRPSLVVHPFTNLERFNLPRKPGRNYLMVTAFAPYKRLDLAIQAFNRLKLPLLIVGSGQDESRLKKLAGPTVDFLGPLGNSATTDLYSKCKAFIFPGIEDFGIAPLEAMAAGAPVIACKEGGVTETVTEKTGVFFYPQTVEALMEAVLKVENQEVHFTEADCRARAALFSKARFQKEFLETVTHAWAKAGKNPADLVSGSNSNSDN